MNTPALNGESFAAPERLAMSITMIRKGGAMRVNCGGRLMWQSLTMQLYIAMVIAVDLPGYILSVGLQTLSARANGRTFRSKHQYYTGRCS